jgi:cobalt/nickel transport system permease protein
MISEDFAVGDSVLHGLDVRLKVIAATVYTVQLAVSMRFTTLSAALILSLVLVALSRLPIQAVAVRLLPLNGFVALFWLVLPLTMPGDPLARLGPLPLSQEGILLAARLTLKANAIFLALIALVSTSSMVNIGRALGLLRFPAKLVHLLLLTYRYIFVIEEEYQKLRRAALVRCFKPRTTLHTYRTYAYMVGMLLVRAADRADRVQQAMRCRGFDGRFHTLHNLAFSRRDRIWATGLGAAVLLIGTMEWTNLLIP